MQCFRQPARFHAIDYNPYASWNRRVTTEIVSARFWSTVLPAAPGRIGFASDAQAYAVQPIRNTGTSNSARYPPARAPRRQMILLLGFESSVGRQSVAIMKATGIEPAESLIDI